MLMNYNLKGNMSFYILFKIITTVFLVLIYHPYDYKCDIDGALDKKSEYDSIIDIDFSRLLAQHELKKKLDNSCLSKNLPDHSKLKDIKNEKNIPTYGQVKKGKSNYLDVYKKEYKNRYGKKRGLAKLDCYYEKNIFDKIEQVHDLAKKFVDDKKSHNKEIYRKFGYLIITLALVQLLGFVIPILFGSKKEGEALINFRTHTDITTHAVIFWANKIILNYLFPILVLLIFIYIFIKIVKYELLKSGKGKINRKEYINFCKDLFKKY
ncbi:hypothetical protein PVNG_03204 [Plasmodium vivax North Korean]|uniref:Variable surface protein Vir35 n=1 Tax=Plasmodium vivax North Korean TaxID=1035514 RepID=A0A0J9TYN4_PLAVI|nr:hypothetical protein PVNG_03204 [Plasmodium vivax North Korean]